MNRHLKSGFFALLAGALCFGMGAVSLAAPEETEPLADGEYTLEVSLIEQTEAGSEVPEKTAALTAEDGAYTLTVSFDGMEQPLEQEVELEAERVALDGDSWLAPDWTTLRLAPAGDEPGVTDEPEIDAGADAEAVVVPEAEGEAAATEEETGETFGPAESVKAASLSDVTAGTSYTLTANMYKVNRKDKSMADGAIDHTVQLDLDSSGDYWITMQFAGLSIYNQYGYLSALKYYNEGYTISGSEITGSTTAAAVLSYQTDTTGANIVDRYNDADNPYPKMVKIKLVDGEDAPDKNDGFVPLQVYVPIMEAISTGSGTQNVLMKLDWSTLAEGTITENAAVEQSAAFDATDSATGIAVHADSGVFDEGVQLVVTELTSGTEYTTAGTALSGKVSKFKLYQISFTDASGNAVTPNGNVTITYPVPSGYTASNTQVYRISNSSAAVISGTLSGSSIATTVNQAGLYAVGEKTSGSSSGTSGTTTSGTTASGTTTSGTTGTSTTNSGTTTTTSAETGDESMPALWALLLIVSGGAALALVRCSRRGE